MPSPKFNSYFIQSPKSFDDLLSCLDKLADRTFIGNEGIDYLAHLLFFANKLDCLDLLSCIVLRDLNAGINEGIIKLLFPDIIQKPKVQLISPFDKDKIAKKIQFPALAQLKVDGARAICIKDEKGVRFLSRSGNQYLGLSRLSNILAIVPFNFVLDGEIIFNPKKQEKLSTFETTPEDRKLSNGIVNKSIQGTISEEESDQFQYVIWDSLSLEEYNAEDKRTTYQERFSKLDTFANGVDIIKVDSQEVNSLQEANALYQKYLSHGYEGIILKNKNLHWADSRSTEAFKFKDEFDLDLRIVGYELHTKKPDLIGSLLVESDDGKIQALVGSGFKEKDEDKLMTRAGAFESAMNNDLVGRIVTIRCNSLIKSKVKDKHSLFLPRLICYRYDKSDTNNFSDIF